MSTIIKKLSQNGQDFAPITVAEAVVVNTANIPGQVSQITTLDKVLRNLGLSQQSFAEQLANKQGALTPGTGIVISPEGVISTTVDSTLYQIVTAEEFATMTAGSQYLNTIYLVPSSNVEKNSFTEYLCIAKKTVVEGDEVTTYAWEQLGSVQADVDLSGYVTSDAFNTFKTTEFAALSLSAITADNVTTSAGEAVGVTYDIPANLYDTITV